MKAQTVLPSAASIGALRAAVLKGRAPPAMPFIARLVAYRWIVVGTVCIGAFMSQVDASITQLLLPRLEHDFGARLSTVTWVVVAYLLANATFLPIFGRLADMVGRKLLYIAGFVLFTVSSLFCGSAHNLPVLIGFRILQGMGGALLGSNSVAIVVSVAGPERRGRALGMQSAAQAVGLGAGPALGGLILGALNWQWVFWINVPLGFVAAIIGWFVIPQDEHAPNNDRFDWEGAFLIVPALAALMIVLNEGHGWGATSPALLGFSMLALVSLTLWIRVERRAQAPLVNLSLFRRSAFSTGNAAGLLSYAALFGVFFLIPFVFIRTYGDSALIAGLRLSIVPVMLAATAPVGGVLYDRFGGHIASVGMLICVASIRFLLIVLDGKPESLRYVMLALAMFGLGQGLFISPNNSAIMAAAPACLTGEAGGLLNAARSIGISFGITTTSALLSWRLQMLTGASGDTIHASAQALLSAIRDAVVLIGVFISLAGALSLADTRSSLLGALPVSASPRQLRK
jgi:EmrB/QacA subfamily drug resistance transporter